MKKQYQVNKFDFSQLSWKFLKPQVELESLKRQFDSKILVSPDLVGQACTRRSSPQELAMLYKTDIPRGSIAYLYT